MIIGSLHNCGDWIFYPIIIAAALYQFLKR
jgi:hypothetical protein